MLERLTLLNFQCHEKGTFDLSHPIVTFCGPSGAGKTSALRGLRWLLFNQPRGDHFVRHGEDSASAKLLFDGDRRLVRKWTRTAGHVYLFDGQTFKAFGPEVPEPIANALNVGPANFARQFDAHWFLSKTAGEVSRELNSIVDLGVIDDTLAAVTSEARKASSEVELTKERLTQAEGNRDALNWVPAYVAKIDELEALKARIDAERARASSIASLVAEGRRAQATYERSSRRALALSRVVEKGRKAIEARRKADSLRELLELYRIEKAKADRRLPDLTRLKELQEKATQARARANKLAALLAEARRAQAAFEDAHRRLRESQERLKSEAGDECPVCGGPMEKQL